MRAASAFRRATAAALRGQAGGPFCLMGPVQGCGSIPNLLYNAPLTKSSLPSANCLHNNVRGVASASAPTVKMLIGGKLRESKATEYFEVTNPATQELVSLVPLCTGSELDEAVDNAKDAFRKWRNTPIGTRSRVMFKLQELIRTHMDDLAANITMEQGKTLADARGDVFRGLEVVEQACGMATYQMGEIAENVSTNIDSYSIRQPLGVTAGICPFNFPAMIPLWMFPVATTCGNTMVMKPSERDPGAAMMLAEMALEAGLPPGVLNVIHGTHDVVNGISTIPTSGRYHLSGRTSPGSTSTCAAPRRESACRATWARRTTPW